MKADWGLLGGAAAAMLALPLLVLTWSGTPLGTGLPGGTTSDPTPQQSNILPGTDREEPEEPPADALSVLPSFRILDETTGQVAEIPAADYVAGAIAAEMPASYEEDALIAQGMSAYTNAHYLAALRRADPPEELNGADFSADPAKRLGYVLELTRESEILAAKTRLHDRIGAGLIAIRQTLLGTRTAEGGAKALQAFRNAVRMIKSDNDSASEKGELAELMQDAEAIGTRIELFGELPEDTDLRKVFLIAIRECLTNGVRHADATLIHAEIVRKNKSILLYITNNGKLPEGVVVPKGGLLNLLRYVADCGGKMKIESLPQYVLSIELPSKNGEIEKE